MKNRGWSRWLMGLVLALCGAVVAPLDAQIIAGRGFGESVVGFDDINGNGVLDCNEPVTIRAVYLDPYTDTTTGSITGEMVAPFSGASGLSFIPGSVEIDPVFSAGDCSATIVTGNAQSDVEATVDFSCGPPHPGNGQGGQRSNVVAFLYRASFQSAQPSFTAAMRGTTSDGLDVSPQLVQSGSTGTLCPSTGGTPSVTVTKTVSGTGAPGSTLLYAITVTDQSGGGEGGLQLTDVVPANTVFDAVASSPGWVCPSTAAGSLCRLPTDNLNPNGSVTRFFAVDILKTLPAGVAAIGNTACARSGPSLVLGCGSVSTPTAGKPVLTMAKSLASGAGVPGGTVVYNLVVVNSGTQDSGPVTLTETVPASTTWAAGGGWTCSGASAGSTCSLALGNIPAGGGGASAQFSVVVANPLPAGVTSIQNTACASAPSAAQACSTVTIPTTGMPLLAVNKTVSGTGVPGSNLTYTIVVQNTGNEGAANVTVTELVPSLTSYVTAGSSASWSCSGTAPGSTCRATIATLPAGASTQLTFVVQIASPLPAGATSIGNEACAAAQGVPTACGTTSIPTAGQPGLHLAKSYSGGAVIPNAVLVFQLAISNTGNQDLGAAVVSETVPPLSTFEPSASDQRWSCVAAAPGSRCTLDLTSVPAGSSQTIAFAVRAAATLPQAAVISNAACVTGVSGLLETARRALRASLRRGARMAQVAAPQACGSFATPPALSVDTTLAATVGHSGPAVPGDRIHYTLSVPNETGSTLTALVSTASLDANTTLVAGSVTTSQGAVAVGNGPGDTTVVVSLGSLAGGATAKVEWDVTVNAHLPPGITEVAAQVDTTGGNIPADESGPPPAPSTPGPTETPVTSGSAPPPPQAIPTLGEWGLGAMIALLGGVATVVLRRRVAV
jgi:uncharacterized repeat protein (TIGR01451 family)